MSGAYVALIGRLEQTLFDLDNVAQRAERQMQLIMPQTRYCLDEYRQFRHIVRHVYTFNFRSSSIQSLATNLRDCLDAVAQDMQQFMQFLKQLTDE